MWTNTPQGQDDGQTSPLASNEENGNRSDWKTTIRVNGTAVVLDSRSPQPRLEQLYEAYGKLGDAVQKVVKAALPPGPCKVTIRINRDNPTSPPLITVKHAGGATQDQVDSLNLPMPKGRVF